MSGETEKSVSAWSIDTLHEHLISRIEALEKALNVALAGEREARSLALSAVKESSTAALLAQERAVTKAEEASEKRFASVNEFRQTLSDQTATFLPRPEAMALFAALAEKNDALQSRLDKQEGRGVGASALWGYAVGLLGVVGVLFGIWKALSK